MANDIQSRLTKAEEEFLSSFNEGTLSLESFGKSWSTLVDTLSVGPLDPDTLCLAHTAAYRVESLASAFLTLHSDSVAIGNNLITELDSLLEQLRIDDRDDAPPPPAFKLRQASGSPPYIGPAYKWLLKNIHNPYPSKEVKSRIAQKTGTSIQNIDAWFLNVRRRIGWTTISKRFFSGSRPDTVAAAKLALIPDDYAADEGLLSANIRMSFVQMEATAIELYSSKFTKSALAGKLDGMVKDLPDEGSGRRKAGRRKDSKLDGVAKKMKDTGFSPTFTRLSTPSSVIGVSEGVENFSSSPIVSGKKRRSSDGDTNEALPTRPSKRPKRVVSAASSCSSIPSSVNSLSSPCSSRGGSCTPSESDDEPQTPLSMSEDLATFSLDKSLLGTSPVVMPRSVARKGRLLEADVVPMPNRQMLARPQAQLVSHPFPKSQWDVFPPTPPSSSSSILSSPSFEIASVPTSEWSSLFFDTPGTAVLGELDLSALREPEFSCVAETAALLNGNRELHKFMSEGSDSSSIDPNLLDITAYDELNPLFGLSHPVSWRYSLGPEFPSSTPCKLGMQSDVVDEPLASLDDFSSLSSLPMAQLASLSSAPTPNVVPIVPSGPDSTMNNIEHIDWFSIIHQPEGFASNNPSDVVDEASRVQGPIATVSMPALPVADSHLHVSTSPLVITPETRAEKLRQYTELLNQAKQLEVELGHA